MKQTIAILMILVLAFLVGCSQPEEDLQIQEVPAENIDSAFDPEVEPETQEDTTEITDATDADVDLEDDLGDEEELDEEETGTNETVEDGTVEDADDPAINETEVEELESQEVITIFDFQPTPDELEIKIGTTVTWRNEDENFQHIIGWSKIPVKPGVIKPGEEWAFTFTEPGEVIWYSTAKPTVQGLIIVTE